jgi:hypothetical protein
MTHNPDNVEDVLKIDSDHGDVATGDDPADSWRYGIMSRPSVAFESKPDKRDRYNQKSRRRGSWQTA